MIVPTDKDYTDTKQILKKEKELNPIFLKLIDWISIEFNQRVLNLYYDTIDNGKRPRLNVIFENYPKSVNTIRDRIGNYAKEKQQKIKRKFEELISNEPATDFKTENLHVIFSAFNPIARAEANGYITEEFLNGLKAKYKRLKIWELSRFGGSITVFFYTEKELEEKRQSPEIIALREEYLEQLKKYDEFNVVKSEEFIFRFDSKENFDNKYESNWYYYYK
ncbi:MAG: hypothetical protein P8M05_09005 [Flavobacteriales bacterium]|jgi:hypothetical protein|nr:hypothetical protein [Flavobacteriales bacterium]